MTSGIQQRDNATWQVINQLIDILRGSNLAILEVQDEISGGGTGGAGITQLTGDVTAGPGSGSQVATIAPLAVTTGKIADLAVTTGKLADDAVTEAKLADDAVSTDKIVDAAVTYEKIQQISQTSVLLGNGDISAPATVQEIGLGENLSITDGTLQVELDTEESGGGTGLGHRVLSGVHFDSLPAEPILGDLIYAGPGGDFEGSYVNGVLLSPIIEDFEGIRAGYMLGFNGEALPTGNVVWGAPPPLEYIDNELPETWLTWNIIDGFAQTTIIEDFEGVRAGYMGGQPGINLPYIVPRSGGYSGYPVLMIPAPDLANPLNSPLWQRLAISETEGQILQKNEDGMPEWTENLELAGDAQIDGDVNIDGDLDVQGDLDALNASVTVQNLTALGAISAPQINGHTLGVWADVTFDAANFTANGGTTPTWTLTSPDQVQFRYCYIGAGTMVVQVYLATTTVASVAGAVTELRIKIPESQVCVGTASAQLVGAQENGAAVFDIYASCDPATSTTNILIKTFPVGAGRAFDQTANASYFGFTIIIRIA